MQNVTTPINQAIMRVFDSQNIGSKLFEFYKRIAKDRYKYVIIVPRKCLTEFKCVSKADTDIFVSGKTTFMTTKGFVRYRDQIRKEVDSNAELPDNYMAIVDDIMIYGRGINRFIKQLLDSFDSAASKQKLIKKIYLEIFIESNNKFQIDEEYKEILEERYNCYLSYSQYSAVKHASDLFLKSFYATATPNTSFVRSWFLESGCSDELIKIEENEVRLALESEAGQLLHVKNIEQNMDQKEEKFFSGILCSDDSFLKDLCEFRCIRYYYNEKLQKNIFIPYVILKPLKIAEIDRLLEIFYGFIKDLFDSESKNDLICSYEEDVDYAILKYEYLILIISDLYGLYLLKRVDENLLGKIGDGLEDDSKILQFSFGKQNLYCVKDLMQIWNDELEKSIEEAFEDYSVSENQFESSDAEQDAQNILNIMAQNFKPNAEKNEAIWFIAEYFDKNSKADEIKAKKKEDRIYGISTGSFIRNFHNFFELDEEKDIDFYSEIIKYMDSGIASLTVKNYKVNGEERIASFLNAGEQAYRIKIDKYMHVFEYLSKIEIDCRNLQILNLLEKKVDVFLDKVLTGEIMKETKKKEIAAIRDWMRESQSSYSDMFVNRKYGVEELEKKDNYEKFYHEAMR